MSANDKKQSSIVKEDVNPIVGDVDGDNMDGDLDTQDKQKRLKQISLVQSQLDEKDKKIKDMQMNRLQSKLRYFIRIEKELR